MSPDILSKSELRQHLLLRRRKLSSADREKAAEKAVEILLASPIFQQSHEIACYYPREDEFDCLPIIQKIWDSKKNCYLPVLSSTNARHLDFVHYEKNTVLKPNRYHIPEPTNKNFIPVEKLDLVILPVVGFDLKGNRLGMGAGYYDHTFPLAHCFLLGLAYEMQKVTNLPHDPWDASLHGVLTEKRMILF